MPINTTVIVTSADEAGGKTAILFDSVKTDDAGKPTFSLVMELPANHPAVKAMPKDAIVGITFNPTGGVVLVEPEPVTKEIALPVPENTPGVKWMGAAAVTNSQLSNPDVNELKRSLGIIGGTISNNPVTVADAVHSAPSQYPGDR